MKTWKQFLSETDGLAGDINHGSVDKEELRTVKRAIRIAYEAGEEYRQRVVKFLKRMSRELPQMQNLVDQLSSPEDGDMPGNNSTAPPPAEEKKMMVVSPPVADQNQGGNYSSP